MVAPESLVIISNNPHYNLWPPIENWLEHQHSIGNFIQPNRWDSHTIIITAVLLTAGPPSSLIVIVQVVATIVR